MRNFFLLVFALTCLSCSKDDDTPEIKVPEINQYRIEYMDYATGIMPVQNSLVKLEYNTEGKVTRRWGNLLPFTSTTGYNFIFSDGLYDEVTYQGNKINILQGDTLKNVNIMPYSKSITVNDGKMVNYTRERIIYTPFTPVSFTTVLDTTWLYYNQNSLSRTVTKDRNTILIKDFNFDGNNNLIEIKGISIDRYGNDTISFLNETFSDYDNSSNPLKKLSIFDELFYRSLSRNNYRKYTRQQFSPDSSQFSKETKNWNFKYDSAGNVKFNE